MTNSAKRVMKALAAHRHGCDYETVGVYVVTDAPGTDVRFDNVLVRVPGR